MPTAKAPSTPAQYLASLPADRRAVIKAVADTINKNLPKGYEFGIQYNMLGWFVPHSVYPAGYHCDPKQPVPFIGLANQKNHVGLYMFCLYTEAEAQQRFVDEWKATGHKLDMGKACIRFKSLDDVPLPVIGRAVKRATLKKFLASYEGVIPASKKKTASKKTTKKTSKKTTKTATRKKATAKKTTKKAARR